MRKGTIKRPAGAKDAIIRLTGKAEPPTDETATVEIPNVRAGWDEILHGIFGECPDTPHAKRRRRKR